MKDQAKDQAAFKPQEIAQKWQKKWEETKLYSPDIENAKKPYYVLMMFPYPSAEGLHIGSIYSYTGADTFARFKRMQGYDVFHPMGLDSFGIHSENYALKIGKHSMDQAKVAEENFYRQLQATGNSYDWTRKLETSDIDYYRWTQWLFVQLFKAGLAYRKKSPVNFCPSCKTVLADEQVIDGKCERCSSLVEKRDLEQWFFRITDYAEPLLQNIPALNWAEKVKNAQHNWIGKKEGAKVTFKVQSAKCKVAIDVFTTRPDTLYGVTALILSTEHSLLKEASFMEQVKEKESLNKYVKEHINESLSPEEEAKKEKTGIDTGVKAVHPITGEEVPIWVSDYVLMGYGTGAIMAVPAHDERDYEFAMKFGIPIKYVIMPSFIDSLNPPQEGKENTTRSVVIVIVRDPKTEKYLCLKWKQQPWTTFITGGVEKDENIVEAAKREVQEETGYKNIELVRVLGGPTEAFFYAAHKNVNRQTRTYSVLFELINCEKDDVSSEEKQQHEAVWLSAQEVVESKLRHAEFYLIWDRIITGNDVYTGEGVLVDSDDWSGLSYYTPEGREKIFSDLVAKHAGERQVNYHLRDWLISRQRYWGPPIPMIYCETCAKGGRSWFTQTKKEDSNKRLYPAGTTFPEVSPRSARNDESMAGWYPEETLPVELPYIEDYRPLGTGASPLGNHPDFYETTCPQCGSLAKRETDVSDTFLDSAWYFFRYTSTDLDTAAFDPVRVKKWIPTEIYIGGAEHSVLHLLYARFITHVLKDLGYIEFSEPFARFFANGLIVKDGAKMSKSKGNVILPDPLIEKFGIDTVRMYLRFLGPFSEGGDFKDTGIEGMHRFVKRVWILFAKFGIQHKSTSTTEGTTFAEGSFSDAERNSTFELEPEGLYMLHKTIKGVTEDMEELRFNTAIAKLMEYYNFIMKHKQFDAESAKVFLKLLAPFVPHMTEEIWEQMGESFSIHTNAWPTWDPQYLTTGTVVIVVQVNGKLRDTLQFASDDAVLESKAVLESTAKESKKVANYLEGKVIKQVIYVPKKIINFVI